MKQRIRTLGYVSPVILLIGLGIYYINGLWDMLSTGLTVLGAACGIVYLVVCFDDLRQAFSARSFRSGTNSLQLRVEETPHPPRTILRPLRLPPDVPGAIRGASPGIQCGTGRITHDGHRTTDIAYRTSDIAYNE